MLDRVTSPLHDRGGSGAGSSSEGARRAPGGGGGSQPYWCFARPRNTDYLDEARESALGATPAPNGYSSPDPHTTIHPGFTAGPEGLAEVAALLAWVTSGENTLGDPYWYPSPIEPRLACVPVETDGTMGAVWRAVERAADSVDTEPRPPHITLLEWSGHGPPPKAEPPSGVGPAGTEWNGFCVEARR